MKKLTINGRTINVEDSPITTYNPQEFIKDKKEFNPYKNTVSKTIENLSIIKKYGDKYKLTTLKFGVKRKGYEGYKRSEKNTVYEGKLSNNIIRAKTKIQEYAICNDFDYFITFTLDKAKYNRYDLNKFNKDLGQFIRDERKRTKQDIQYLFIPEKHQDGAWHIHGLIKGIKKEELKKFKDYPKEIKIKKQLRESEYYNFERYQRKFGFCSLGEIKDKEKVSSYITKYLNKELANGVEQGNKSYYNSRGLKLAEEIKRGTLQSPHAIKYDYENEYIKTKKLTDINDIIII